MNLQNLPPLITVMVAASIANVSVRHMRDLLNEGKVKGVKVGDAWRVNTAALLKQLGLDEQASA